MYDLLALRRISVKLLLFGKGEGGWLMGVDRYGFMEERARVPV
jgi:hypothetical protein